MVYPSFVFCVCKLKTLFNLLLIGSAMSFTPGVQVLFEQLGMLEELHKISLPFPRVLQYNEHLEFIGELVNRNLKEL